MSYCEKHGIAVNQTANREELEAAIARSYLHMLDVNPSQEMGCYGFWSETDMNCQKFCDLKNECCKVSLGMTEAKYRSLEKTVKRVRFADPIVKKRRR